MQEPGSGADVAPQLCGEPKFKARVRTCCAGDPCAVSSSVCALIAGHCMGWHHSHACRHRRHRPPSLHAVVAAPAGPPENSLLCQAQAAVCVLQVGRVRLSAARRLAACGRAWLLRQRAHVRHAGRPHSRAADSMLLRCHAPCTCALPCCRHCGQTGMPHEFFAGSQGCTGECWQPHDKTYPREYKPPV
jgi:hypothetical protein